MSGGAGERIDLFHEDCLKLSTGEGLNLKRISSEIMKLRKWLQKHQNETLPENSKGKLMSVLQVYYKLRERLMEVDYINILEGLIDDYLKLPEGKLTTSKSKHICLNWLDELKRIETNEEMKESGIVIVDREQIKRYIVADINDDHTLVLMSPDPNSDEMMENARIKEEITEELLTHIRNTDSNCTIYVNVQISSRGDEEGVIVSYELADINP